MVIILFLRGSVMIGAQWFSGRVLDLRQSDHTGVTGLCP